MVENCGVKVERIRIMITLTNLISNHKVEDQMTTRKLAEDPMWQQLIL